MEAAGRAAFVVIGGGLIGVAAYQYGVDAWALILIGSAVVLALYYLVSGLAVLAIFLRALFALVPIAAIAAGLIYGVLQIEGWETGEQRAVIAAIVVAAGWVVAFVTGEMRQVNQEQERRRDLIEAALAEVKQIIVIDAGVVSWDEEIAQMQARFFRDPEYKVFVKYGHQFDTIRRLAGQIEILNRAQISDVMPFLQLLSRIEQMEDRMSSEAFEGLPSEERALVVTRYYYLQNQIRSLGPTAEAALSQRPFQGVLRHWV